MVEFLDPGFIFEILICTQMHTYKSILKGNDQMQISTPGIDAQWSIYSQIIIFEDIFCQKFRDDDISHPQNVPWKRKLIILSPT